MASFTNLSQKIDVSLPPRSDDNTSMTSNNPNNLRGPELLDRLEKETTAALDRIYKLDDATPMSSVVLESGCTLNLKREDTSRVHSYKWRGATNKISHLVEQGFDGALGAASPGDQAQGIALAA